MGEAVAHTERVLIENEPGLLGIHRDILLTADPPMMAASLLPPINLNRTP
jgi:hypothetical protein